MATQVTCPYCGYDVTGIPKRCPECGHHHANGKRWRPPLTVGALFPRVFFPGTAAAMVFAFLLLAPMTFVAPILHIIFLPVTVVSYLTRSLIPGAAITLMAAAGLLVVHAMYIARARRRLYDPISHVQFALMILVMVIFDVIAFGMLLINCVRLIDY